MRYSQHREKWLHCDRCFLQECRNKIVLGRGSLPCEILFVGEAPGISEDVRGRPFHGPAGKLLDKMIDQATSLSREFSYAITNLIGCIPKLESKDDEGDGQKVNEPPKEAVIACRPRLIEFIKMARPQIIVTVGKHTAKYTPSSVGDYELISITHPAAILRMDISQKGLVLQQCIVTIAEAVDSLG